MINSVRDQELAWEAFEDVAQGVIEAACVVCGCSETEFRGAGRAHNVVVAREVVVYILRNKTALSFPMISEAMGRNGHSTLVDAYYRAVRKMRDPDATLHRRCLGPAFASIYGAVIRAVGSVRLAECHAKYIGMLGIADSPEPVDPILR